ncbi:DHH family phosphoesterase [bacterium]|nr:DHH family phosphoesterase [candidate division CSSED10-310 bacterium]
MALIAQNFEQTRVNLKALLSEIKRSNKLLILTHDNPDPDSIASAVTLKYIARHLCGNPAQIAFGGLVGRAENREMIRLLHLRLRHMNSINWTDYDSLALVDHQPRRGWIRWPKTIQPNIIIDHHPRRRLSNKVAFTDVRKRFGSSSTVLYQYLKAAQIPIPKFVATALAYGIRSDTLEFSRGTYSDDLIAYHELFPRCDHKKIGQILYPVRTIDYVQEFWLSMHNVVRCADVVGVYAGKVSVPDITAEIADWMVHIQGVKWSIATAYTDEILFISVRSRSERKDAGRIIRKVVGRSGSAGGHGFMAGGQIRFDGNPEKAVNLSQDILKKFFKILKGEDTSIEKFQKMIPHPGNADMLQWQSICARKD